MPLNKSVLLKAPVKALNSTTKLVNGLIAMINELAQIMENEIVLIEGRRMKEHAELLKTKQRLTLDYRSTLKTVALQPQLLKEVPEDIRAAARGAAAKLSVVSERNAKVLRAAIVAVEKLAKTIVGIVKDEVLPKGGYINPNNRRMTMSYSPICKPVTGIRTA